MTMKHFFPIVLLSLTLAGCDKPEPIPAYLRIEPFAVNAQGGAEWQEITDAWVYVDGQLLGAFALPAEFPVLDTNEVKLDIFPGIKENGSLDTPGPHLFLEPYTKTVNLSEATTTTITPATRYYATTKYAWSLGEATFDDFSAIPFENRDGDTSTTFRVTADGGFAGKCLLMEVDTPHVVIEIASLAVPLPTSGAEQVWLEMHYRNDVEFAMFLLGESNNSAGEESLPIYAFNPTEQDSWNKIYINLTDFVSRAGHDRYRLFFRTLLSRDATGQYPKVKGAVRLDNIRLIHF
jgi:hypothetical protein